MKTTTLALVISCLVPTLANAYYEVTSCTSSSVPVFNNTEGCKGASTQTTCFTHPGYSSAKVTGCTSNGCYDNYTWEEFRFSDSAGSSLGSCTSTGSGGTVKECYTTSSSGSYMCAAGCYGAAVYTGNGLTGCKKCPENSTCANACQGCAYTCNDGYYSSNNYCLPCPDHATCKNNRMTCSAGYYLTGTYCTRCPLSSDGSPASGGQQTYGYSASGATSITGCYLSKGYPFTDSTGSYSFSENCYYKN